MLKRIAVTVLLLMLSSVSSAQIYYTPPADGLWWNAAESGRGWTFETQDNITVVTHYTYRTDGSSTFFTTAGIWNGPGSYLQASLSASEGGQCVGCGYIRPVSTNLGAMRFEFTSSFTGSAIYPNGVVVPIEKYDFVYSSSRAYLKGDWASTWIAPNGNAFTNVIRFDRDCVTCDASSVEGRLILTNSGRIAFAGQIPNSRGAYQVLVDATTSYYDYYFVIGDALKWSGFACTRLKTDPPPATVSECPGLMFASRSKSYAAIPVAGAADVVSKQSLRLGDDRAEAADIAGARAISSKDWEKIGPVSWDDLLLKARQ